jgi:hypothetical protein
MIGWVHTSVSLISWALTNANSGIADPARTRTWKRVSIITFFCFYVTLPLMRRLRTVPLEDFDWSASIFWSDALPDTTNDSFVDAPGPQPTSRTLYPLSHGFSYQS